MPSPPLPPPPGPAPAPAPRVLGIDPGTVSIDLVGLEGSRVWLDRSLPTRDALSDPEGFLALLRQGGVPDLIAGPSGYGLPLVPAARAGEDDLRLAYLAPEGETGGIGGLRQTARLLARSGLPVVFTPGVIHLATVPPHRKLNRVDLGTADKVAAAALGIWHQAGGHQATAASIAATRFILLELGGAFTAALAVEAGGIIDGVGGTSGPMGWEAGGAWDGEVAFLAGQVGKAQLFRGGRTASPRHGLAAYIEQAHKAVLALTASLASPRAILLSGRRADDAEVLALLEPRLAAIAPVERLNGFTGAAKQGAQGAALLASGLAGGPHAPIVDALRLRDASGTALDYLTVITPEEARRRIGVG